MMGVLGDSGFCLWSLVAMPRRWAKAKNVGSAVCLTGNLGLSCGARGWRWAGGAKERGWGNGVPNVETIWERADFRR